MYRDHFERILSGPVPGLRGGIWPAPRERRAVRLGGAWHHAARFGYRSPDRGGSPPQRTHGAGSRIRSGRSAAQARPGRGLARGRHHLPLASIQDPGGAAPGQPAVPRPDPCAPSSKPACARSLRKRSSRPASACVGRASRARACSPQRKALAGNACAKWSTRIYAPPTPLDLVLDQIDAWMESPSLMLLTESEQHWQELRSLIAAARLSGPQVHDARIAALCMQHGVRTLWSADRDFSRFPRLTIVNPLI